MSETLGVDICQYLANVGVDDGKAADIAHKMALKITNKEIKLLELVKSLGDYLTAEDDLLRPKATMCLSATLNDLDKNCLTSHDIAVLNAFYTSKLEDLKSMKETLSGVSTLVDMQSFNPSLSEGLLVAIEKNYESKNHLASTRYLAFEVLNKIHHKFGKYLQKIKHLQDIYIKAFIQVASGEKDPKNLLLSFQLNSEISSTLDIEDFQDDMFDILFCYFPISFKPPKDDPYKITSDQLKQSLRKAISNSAFFAKDSYPNLLEKLTSTSPSVKTDTLETLTACIESYGHDSLLTNWTELWNGLKFEILHNSDDDEDETGVVPLVLTIFKAISLEMSKVEIDFDKFFDAIFNELKPNFTNKLVKPSCLIFGSIASANLLTFNKVTQKVMPTLLENSNDLNVPKQRTLIGNIAIFTNAYIDVLGRYDDIKQVDHNNALLSFKDELLIIFGKALMGSSKVEVSLRTLSIAELTKITTLSNFLESSELSLIVQYFTETVIIDDNEYIFNSCIGGLVQIGKINTNFLLEITFPTLLSLLPNKEGDLININDEQKPKEKIFEIISSITTNKEIVNFLMIRLLNKLVDISDDSQNLNYSFLIVSTVQDMIITSQRTQQFPTDDHLTTSFTKLVGLLLSSENGNVLNDDSVMESATEILKLIVVYSSKNHHQSILDETLKIFTNEEIVDTDYYKGVDKVDIFTKPTKLINVSTKIISSLDKSTKFVNVDSFFAKLISLVQHNESFDDNYIKIGYLRTIALISNKWIEDSTKYQDFLSLDSKINIEVFTWITKGIIMKIDPKSEVFITKLVDLLSSEKYGSIVTKSFEILVIEMSIFEKFKSKFNNNVRLLYKQKFFEIISPRLVEGFQNATNMKEKSNFLTALSLILKHTKKEIIIPHLSSFFPLLLQSLSIPNSDVRLASVQTILSSVEEISELICKHLDTIMRELLTMIQLDSKGLNNEQVRIMSLNCLHSFTLALPLEKLIPYQQEIIQRLTPVLDDKKRRVRKSAVDARQAYFELGRSPID